MQDDQHSLGGTEDSWEESGEEDAGPSISAM